MPFSCAYCLSAIDKRVRFRDMDLVKRELKFFLDMQVPQVKFIDRTFNVNGLRTMELLTFIKENDNLLKPQQMAVGTGKWHSFYVYLLNL